MTAVAAGTVAALALLGGTYATFVAQDTAPGQDISSATSSLIFTKATDKQTFAATYSKLAAGDSVVSFIDLTNNGTNSLESLRISQASTDVPANPGGKATLESAGGEGLSVTIERVDGTDSWVSNQLATTKLADLRTPAVAIPLTLAPTEVAHLKFTVTLDQAAIVQNQSLSTVYTVDANQVVGAPPFIPFALTGTDTNGTVPASWTAAPGAFSYTLNRVATTTGAGGQFTNPASVAVGTDGTLYVSDRGNHRIRKVTPTGDVSTLAGSGQYGFADGPGATAQFYAPFGIAVDVNDNVYVADSANLRVRKITPAGVVSTLAGSGVWGMSDGPGATATFKSPTGIAVNSAGVVFVTDEYGANVRKIMPDGTVSTLTGAGEFWQPHGIAVAPDGNMYVADSSNSRIRKVTSAGVVTDFAGTAGVDGTADGNGPAAQFNTPTGIAVDASNNVYVADFQSHRVRKITPTRDVTTLAGSTQGFANGTGAAAKFSSPSGLAALPDGTVYVAEYSNNRIRKITSTGDVTTLAGRAIAEDGTGAGALLRSPVGVATGADGTMYVADRDANLIRKVTAAGVVTTLAGGKQGYADGTGAAAQFAGPSGVAVTSTGTVYVSDTYNSRIREITPGGVVTTLAGSGSFYFEDGTGTAATFNQPMGLAVAPNGTVYVADYDNHRIRAITPGGVVTSLAGYYGTGTTDGTGEAALFNHPKGVAVGANGTLYVADSDNNRIRKITPGGVVTTLTGGNAGFLDGNVATAQFSKPTGIAIGADSTVYVADADNNRVRKITPGGQVSTLAGSATAGLADGPGATAKFSDPQGVTVVAGGTVYVADRANNRIRKVTPGGAVSILAGSMNGFADTTPTVVDPSVLYTGPARSFIDTTRVPGVAYTYTVTANGPGTESNIIGPFVG